MISELVALAGLLAKHLAVIAIHCPGKIKAAYDAIKGFEAAAKELSVAVEEAGIAELAPPLEAIALLEVAKAAYDFAKAGKAAKDAFQDLWGCMNEASQTDNVIKQIVDEMKPHWEAIKEIFGESEEMVAEISQHHSGDSIA